jgi:heme/copper-type cytochrome/quinol oxidase subunit 4
MTSAESMGLAEASNAAIYATMVTLSIAMVLFAASFASGRRRSTTVSQGAVVGGRVAVLDRPEPSAQAEPGRKLANVAMSLTWLATGLLTLALVLRGIWAGRVPWGNMYEFSISSAWGVLVVFLAMSTRRDLRWLGLFVVFPALLTLGLAVTVLYTEAAQLVPALKSYWLVIHVSAAIICAGAFTVAASSAALPACSQYGRLARRQGVVDRDPRARHLLDQLLRREHLRQQPALVRRAVAERLSSPHRVCDAFSCSRRRRQVFVGSVDRRRVRPDRASGGNRHLGATPCRATATVLRLPRAKV